MADKKALSEAFITQLLAHVPEDQREAVGATLRSDAVADVIATREATLSDWHAQLDDWYTRAQTTPSPKPAPAPALQSPATAVFTLDDVKKEASKIAEATIAREMDGAAKYFDVVLNLNTDHFKEFGEKLDVAALRQHPEVAAIGILGVYEKVHGPKVREKREAAAKVAAETREAEIRADERRKVAKESPGPYPVSGREPSVLDAIKPDPTKAAANLGPSVDELTDAYNAEVDRLSRQTVGAPS